MLTGVLTAGCSEIVTITPLDQHYGSVVVKVTDERGTPIADVELDLRNAVRRMAYGSTGPDGIFRFEFIPPESYLINITPPEAYAVPADHPNPVLNVAVERGAVTAVPVIVTDQVGQVRVRVADEAGAPVSGVMIELRSAFRSMAFGSTDGTGTVTFRQVPQQSYLLNITSPAGYTTAAGQPNPVLHVVVQSSATTEVSVALAKAP